MRLKVIILLVVGLILLLLVCFNYNTIILGYIFNTPVTKVTELKMKNGSIFLKDLRKGLDTEIKVISATSHENFDADEKSEYIFRNGLDIFYKVKTDTLILFVRKKATEPVNFPQNLYVKQVQLSNPDYMNLYVSYVEENYEIF